MLDLTDPGWAQLSHAYGGASDIPELLTRARTDRRPGHQPDGAWFALWSALCHQGDAYTASYAAVPHLVAIAREWGAAGGHDPVLLVACIELGRLEGTGPAVPPPLASAYHKAVAEAATLAATRVAEGAHEDSRRAYAGSLAALRGDVRSARAVFDADTDE